MGQEEEICHPHHRLKYLLVGGSDYFEGVILGHFRLEIFSRVSGPLQKSFSIFQFGWNHASYSTSVYNDMRFDKILTCVY